MSDTPTPGLDADWTRVRIATMEAEVAAEKARADRAEAAAGALRHSLAVLVLAADDAPWVEDARFDAARKASRDLLLATGAGEAAAACVRAVEAQAALDEHEQLTMEQCGERLHASQFGCLPWHRLSLAASQMEKAAVAALKAWRER